MTQLESARKGISSPEMIRVTIRENIAPDFTASALPLAVAIDK